MRQQLVVILIAPPIPVRVQQTFVMSRAEGVAHVIRLHESRVPTSSEFPQDYLDYAHEPLSPPVHDTSVCPWGRV
eukprot:8549645-Pyramimonas_sp.AAC.1